MRLCVFDAREDSTSDGPRHGQHARLVPQLTERHIVVVSTREQEDILIHPARNVAGAESARRLERVEGRRATKDMHGLPEPPIHDGPPPGSGPGEITRVTRGSNAAARVARQPPSEMPKSTTSSSATASSTALTGPCHAGVMVTR